ncbi:MAG: hypothetical protein PHE27_00185 [Alphaproteobacteria bacterium]|nr:hypothetical protein [Alphaproteobacteria bacterium]
MKAPASLEERREKHEEIMKAMVPAAEEIFELNRKVFGPDAAFDFSRQKDSYDDIIETHKDNITVRKKINEETLAQLSEEEKAGVIRVNSTEIPVVATGGLLKRKKTICVFRVANQQVGKRETLTVSFKKKPFPFVAYEYKFEAEGKAGSTRPEELMETVKTFFDLKP